MFRKPTQGYFNGLFVFLLSLYSYRRGRRKSSTIMAGKTGRDIKIFNFPFVHWSTRSEIGSKTIFDTVRALHVLSGRELDIILKAREFENKTCNLMWLHIYQTPSVK